jgi:transposase InsO family protein
VALREKTIVEQRIEAMGLLAEGWRVADVAARFGVSRQAVYDWKRRLAEDPENGLSDRSRAPHHSPTRTEESIEERLIEERRVWGFGSKKILRRLQDSEPSVIWPPRSTVDAIFKRAGLVAKPRRVQRHYTSVGATRPWTAKGPGQVITVDFKGQFRLRSGRYCYPLTVADPYSRYVLACDAFDRITFEQTWTSLKRVFREHGLPEAVHSDNGVPFGTAGKGRFSSLSVCLMKYGVAPLFSRPGHPEDNGVHERMHRTLKEQTAIHPARTIAGQQRLFDTFRRTYNEERPHEGIGLDRPKHRYRRSQIVFPSVEPTLDYDPRFERLTVNAAGNVHWRNRRIFIAESFAAETIALEPIDYTRWRVHYGKFVVGILDEQAQSFL